jgi:hypothetical protein
VSDISITRKKGENGGKQQGNGENTEPELLKEFAELLADGVSTTVTLELAEKILILRKQTMSAADSHIAGELIKGAIKEVLTEYGLAPQSKLKEPHTRQQQCEEWWIRDLHVAYICQMCQR